MRKLFTLLIVAIFATATLGCEKNQDSSDKSDESSASESKTQKAEAEKAEKAEEPDEDEAETGDKVAMVDVPNDGKEFDPAVEKSRVPGDTWICDMGTVHWASKEKPEDGKCPICGMQLSEHTHAGDSPK